MKILLKFNLLQRGSVKLIKKLIGIDIFKNESTGGALSVYNKLPAFHVGKITIPQSDGAM